MTSPNWPDDIFTELRRLRARQIAYVPDAGHSRLIERCQTEPTMSAVALTTEEEGVALLAGAWLGGQRGALLMQSSGVGNCMNMLSLTRACGLPLLLLVTMRGQWGEFNPWQLPMGQNARALLETCGVRAFEASRSEQVGEFVAAAGRSAFLGSIATAVLISQRVIGSKTFAGETLDE